MNKTQFTNRWVHMNLPQQELDRKWRLQLEQQEQEQFMLEAQAYQAAQNATPVAAAGYANDSFNEFVELDYIDDYFEL